MNKDFDPSTPQSNRRKSDPEIEYLVRKVDQLTRPQNWILRHWHVLASVGSVVVAVVLLFPRVDAIEKQMGGVATKPEVTAQLEIRDERIRSLDSSMKQQIQNLKGDVTEIKGGVKDNNKLLQQLLREMPKAQ